MRSELGTQAGSSAGVNVIRLAGRLSLETVHDFISVSGWIDLLPACASVNLAICQVKM
jgi:hypothetical protein